MIGVLNVVGHDAVHAGFVDCLKGFEIRPHEIRIVEAHGPAVIIGTRPLTRASVNLAHLRSANAVNDDRVFLP